MWDLRRPRPVKLIVGILAADRQCSLAGLEGTVIRRRGAERLLVVVEFLQQGASVQLDDFQVERIDG